MNTSRFASIIANEIDVLLAKLKTKSDTAFIGHPWGLAWLSASEFWERFSYYGVQPLLVLYLLHYLLLPGHAEQVWGFETFRQMLKWIYGAHIKWSEGVWVASNNINSVGCSRITAGLTFNGSAGFICKTGTSMYILL